MKIHILTIGDELLIGQVLDTNAHWISKTLTEIGVDIHSRSTVSDNQLLLKQEIERVSQEVDLVLMTGGLGPTRDDVTTKVLAELTNDTLQFHDQTWLRLKSFLNQYKREPNNLHRQQCHLPSKATLLTNSQGTAPGMWLSYGDTVLLSLPGVPYEMKALIHEQVIPKLQAEYHLPPSFRKTIMTIGMGESEISETIDDIETSLPDHISIAFLPRLGRVRIRLTGYGDDLNNVKQDVLRISDQIVKRIQHLVYGFDDIEFEQHIIDILKQHHMMLATAESCTGGLIARKITSISGSSAVFAGSVVAYSNDVKKKLLGVQATTLNAYGAVSEETIREMINGVLEATGADIALATSGIAGPTGGTPDKPVGTIWIAVGTKENTKTKLLQLSRDRAKNVEITALFAMNMLRRLLSA